MDFPYFSEPSDPNFLVVLDRIHKQCRKLEVSYSLNFEDGPNTWYFTVSSPAPTEKFVGKSYGLYSACISMLEHLDSIDHISSS